MEKGKISRSRSKQVSMTNSICNSETFSNREKGFLEIDKFLLEDQPEILVTKHVEKIEEEKASHSH